MASSTGSVSTAPTAIDPSPPSDAAASLRAWNAICVSLCLVVTTVTVILRTYVRGCLKKQWILEDFLCCISWLGLVAYCVLMTITTFKHAGAHQSELPSWQTHEAIYWLHVTTIVYIPAVLGTKVAIILFYRRIFSPQHRGPFDKSLLLFIVILCCFYFANGLVKIWGCRPRARIWNKSIPGQCLDFAVVLDTSGLFNLLTDFIILLIPVKAVWKMRLSTRRKAGVIGVFTLGLMAPAFSIVGSLVRLKVSSNPDVTHHQPMIQLWAAAEVSTGLICVCVPTLAALKLHRGPLRPTQSIINGQSNGVSRRSACKKGSLDHFDRIEMLPHPVNMESEFGVKTGIEGGLHKPFKSNGERYYSPEFSGKEDGEIEATGIMTSVKIEQTYV